MPEHWDPTTDPRRPQEPSGPLLSDRQLVALCAGSLAGLLAAAVLLLWLSW